MSLSTTLRRALTALEQRPRQYEDLIEELRLEIDKLERRADVLAEKKERRAAVAGETFRRVVGEAELSTEVHEKFPGKDGRWLCISCGYVCEHQLDRDLHCKTQGLARKQRRIVNELGDASVRHVLAWWNFSTGHVEVP